LSRWCSFRLSVINWWHVFTGAYAPWVLWAVLAATVAQLVPLFRSMDTTAFASALSVSTGHVQQLWPLYITLFVLLVLILNHRSNPVFLLDFACAQPPESWKTTHQGGCRRVPWCRRGAIRRPLRACDILRTDCSGGGCGCCVGSRGALGVTAGWQLPAGLLFFFLVGICCVCVPRDAVGCWVWVCSLCVALARLSHDRAAVCADVINTMELLGCYTQESLDFQKRLLAQGGLGDATYWPPTARTFHSPCASRRPRGCGAWACVDVLVCRCRSRRVPREEGRGAVGCDHHQGTRGG
jgi:hypothetical protein